MLKTLPRLLLIYGALMITACAGPQIVKQRGDQESKLESWELRAKVGFRTGSKGQSANMIWKKDQSEDDILLFGPFGAGKVQILQSANSTTLIDGDKRYQEADAETLLLQLTGLTFPIEELNWWIQGLVYPKMNPTNIEYDENSRLSSFEQADWSIAYLRYADSSPQALPAKIKLNNAKYTLTIVIQSWTH